MPLGDILSNFFWVIIAAGAIALILTCWKKVPADKALVITGFKKRVLSGRGGFMIPFFETSSMISLENISMTTDVNDAPSKQGIIVNVVGTAVAKIRNEPKCVLSAVEQFSEGGAKNTVKNIGRIVEQILEGQLRGIVSTMTVEEINEDRAAFESKIEMNIKEELEHMGLYLVSYSILKISTQGNYLENRAIPQIESAKSDANIASAERRRDTEIRTAIAEQEGQKARLDSDAQIAKAQKDKMLQVEKYRAEQEQAKAEADIAYELKKIEKQSEIEKQKALLAEQEALTVEKELVTKIEKPAVAKKVESEILAEAEKIKYIKKAEADSESIKINARAEADAIRMAAEAEAVRVRILAEAEADGIRMRGMAEAEATKAKGLAEAEAKDKLADAMAKYGDAAIVELLVSKLPEIMEQIAKPMENIDKITVIDTGSGSDKSGASRIAQTVTNVAGNGFEVLKDLTGMDLSEIIRSFTEKKAIHTVVEEKPIVEQLDVTAQDIETEDHYLV